jgi:hypothetical protein
MSAFWEMTALPPYMHELRGRVGAGREGAGSLYVSHPQEGEVHSGFEEDVDISGKEGGLGHGSCLCLTILFSDNNSFFSGADWI